MRSVFNESVLRGFRKQITADLSTLEPSLTSGRIVVVVHDDDAPVKPPLLQAGDHLHDSPEPDDKAGQLEPFLPPGKLPEPTALPYELPPLVKAFWEYKPPTVPRWRLESAEERQQRDEAAGRGCWTG
jgi:hypothetical protein